MLSIKKIIFSFVAFSSAGFITGANAQLNLATLQDSYNASNAANIIPTYLGDGFKTAQINFFNPHVTIASNFTNYRDGKAFVSSNNITDEMVGNAIHKMSTTGNNIQAGLDIALLNIGINVLKQDNGKPRLSLGFGVDEHVEMNTTFNRDLFLLAYRGNEQFAGQTIDVAPRMNLLAYLDYSVSAAYNFNLPNTDIKIKPAIRLRYLSGQASINMDKNTSITMYTQPDGRYLDFGLNYTVNASTSLDTVKLNGQSFNFDKASLQTGIGHGIGMDLGVRIEPMENLSVNVGLIDIGGLTFTKNVSNIYSHTNYRYDGSDITFNDDQQIKIDSVSNLLKPQYSYNSYKVKLPTKLLLTATMGFGKSEKSNLPYYKNSLTFTYLQGFDNYLSASKVPMLALGYTHGFGLLNAGVNMSVGGIWGFGFGALASLKLGPLRVGVNSNNILPLFAAGSAKGGDIAALLALSF